MPTVSVDGARIPYTTEGSGPRLVLVHGTGPGSELTWGHLVDRLADRSTVVLPDLSGSEKAVDDGGELTVEGLAEQVAAVVDDAGGEPVDLAGFSLGAPVAAAVAATRPDLVRRLVLIAGLARTDEYLRQLMISWRRNAGDPETFGRIAMLTGFSRAHLEKLGSEGTERLVPNMRPTPGILRQVALDLRIDVRDLLPRVRAETLVIGCTRDATVPVENARELHAGIPGSVYAEIDSGHVVVFERPEEVVRLLRDFVHRP
ncbi:alpha/beta fold hydrolase [Sphaerisporangium fuscum]|uniref:alpha/beta fold hydrolase n=1 Tax=Sphaerisporangium fuscum TaxID=2835868 RepID=UPI001BDC0001|nr:alpha/beta hydrolase [Sphaerisporangium fuscum]